ncbi:MAG: heavy-metal-associated domain-containing protein [Alphaproteobacteria bacterium]
MKKFILVMLSGFLFSSNAFASEVVTIKVNGMVCDFCARAVEKVFMKNAAVNSLNVDLSAKQIIVFMKDGETLDDDIITRMITDSGYALVDILRGDNNGDL